VSGTIEHIEIVERRMAIGAILRIDKLVCIVRIA